MKLSGNEEDTVIAAKLVKPMPGIRLEFMLIHVDCEDIVIL